MSLIKLKIEGFHCDACVKIAKLKLVKIPGVSEVEVKLSGDAKIDTEREIGIEEINKALLETGYKAQAV
ncbi:MAG: hypothetical protein UY41_C0015G0009 [Candidatus Moranbacteria bacterium GW2011_GWE1_49_15]|nr:MAG: hypothetical protein UX75_C0004G0026 [Candidatus Moranbacteria bacterium GW2011_GWE2_47_10]KKW06778.1 MAG: hypothetical protein UY41_C0015G0009 [Candidatus Moranbacteria bacterium GW2011_GWE1_49_15]HBP00990.1 hypothetical protein [Candidatus Moranbacteria bacterium]